jgi:hypothetical protein
MAGVPRVAAQRVRERTGSRRRRGSQCPHGGLGCAGRDFLAPRAGNLDPGPRVGLAQANLVEALFDGEALTQGFQMYDHSLIVKVIRRATTSSTGEVGQWRIDPPQAQTAIDCPDSGEVPP